MGTPTTIRIILISLVGMVSFFANETHADTKCSEYALEFSKSSTSLTLSSLAALRSCIGEVTKNKKSDDKNKERSSQDKMSCSTLASSFSKDPASLSLSSLETLKSCIDTVMGEKLEEQRNYKVWVPPMNKGEPA
jgi:hypothetical protein